jgi:hypothetical protein
MSNTTVVIKTLPRKSAYNVSEFRNVTKDGTTGKSMNKTKVGNCNDKIRALYSTKTGNLLTGLDETVANPYFQSKKSITHEFEYVRNLEEITRQELLEIKHGRPKGFYTSRPWRDGDGHSDAELTFFQKFKYTLNDGSTILDLSKPQEELAYYMFKASPLVAESKKPQDIYAKPKASWYIADFNESEKDKFSKRKEYNKCVAKLDDSKFTTSYKKKVAKALDLIKGDMESITDEKIYLMLDSYLQEALMTKEKEVNLHNFAKVYALTESKEGREELEAKVTLSDLINYRIISDAKGTYTWLSKNITIGQREAEAIDWLLDPKKQPEHDELQKQLRAKLIR